MSTEADARPVMGFPSQNQLECLQKADDAERVRVRQRKTIVFAVPEKQASILVRLFNKLLFIETAYDSGNPDLSFDEKLEVRRISSILAAALWAFYRSRSLPVPEVVAKWREICLSPDEFSEIRNAWGDCERV